jgi:pimeloyl-ACP methyl ester carboxylesterase
MSRILRIEPWHYKATGSGPLLILLHGIGMSHAAWNAVTPFLSATRRVIAFDIAGFGSTPPLPNGTHPTVTNLVDGLERSLQDLGIDFPVDMAGNSLGGSLVLEAAARGIARRVVAISPAGLWTEHPPGHVKYVFRGLRFMAVNVNRLLKAAARVSWMREILFAVPISAGSARMPACDARRTIDDLAGAQAFEETFLHTRAPLSVRGIAVPATVVFGNRDWILPRRSRCRDGLPAHAMWIEKHGWGHVPMWIDPAGVAQIILTGTGDAVVRVPRLELKTCHKLMVSQATSDHCRQMDDMEPLPSQNGQHDLAALTDRRESRRSPRQMFMAVASRVSSLAGSI